MVAIAIVSYGQKPSYNVWGPQVVAPPWRFCPRDAGANSHNSHNRPTANAEIQWNRPNTGRTSGWAENPLVLHWPTAVHNVVPREK